MCTLEIRRDDKLDGLGWYSSYVHICINVNVYRGSTSITVRIVTGLGHSEFTLNRAWTLGLLRCGEKLKFSLRDYVEESKARDKI